MHRSTRPVCSLSIPAPPLQLMHARLPLRKDSQKGRREAAAAAVAAGRASPGAGSDPSASDEEGGEGEEDEDEDEEPPGGRRRGGKGGGKGGGKRGGADVRRHSVRPWLWLVPHLIRLDYQARGRLQLLCSCMV